MTVVAVLGSGVMASALAVPLAENGHEIRLVGTHLDGEIIDSIKESGVHPGLQLEMPSAARAYHLEEAATAFAGAEIVLSGVNSFGVRWASEQLVELLPAGAPVIAVAKGLEASEAGDLRTLPEVLTECWSEQQRAANQVCAIVGPSIAGEVAVRHDTCVTFAGRDQPTLDRLAATFETERYHVWTSSDLAGCEVCAATKNCYALGAGLAEGVLEARGESDSSYRMHNYESALLAQGAIEMRQMVALLGGNPDVVDGLPGVGDMYVTSTGGRNVRVGRLLGAGVGFTEAWARLDHITLEGAAAIGVIGAALAKLTQRGKVGAADFPLMRHLYEVIELEHPVAMPWDAFFGGSGAEGQPGAGPRRPRNGAADPASGAD